MNEAMLSYFNRVRVIPYPDFAGVSAPGATFDFPRYGDLPVARAWGAGAVGYKGFAPGVYAGTRLAAGGWLELAGVKSVATSGLDANLQQMGHQQSPGNTQQTAAGRLSPLTAQVVFNYSAQTQAELWVLQPGGVGAPAYPAIDTTGYYPLAYVARAKGRLVFEFIAPDGAWLRTLGTLTIPSAQDAPDDSAPMTITASVGGSGKPLFFTP